MAEAGRAPEGAVGALYELLGLPPFRHDFEHVAYEADAFDAAPDAPGLHRLRGRAEWRPRPAVLPPDLFQRFAGDSFWLRPEPRLDHIHEILKLDWATPPPSPPGR